MVFVVNILVHITIVKGLERVRKKTERKLEKIFIEFIIVFVEILLLMTPLIIIKPNITSTIELIIPKTFFTFLCLSNLPIPIIASVM